MGPASIITFEEDTWNTFPDGDKTFEEDDDAATSAATPWEDGQKSKTVLYFLQL